MNLHFIVWEGEDGMLVAECPALPGCMTQAQDETELLHNMKEAVVAWMLAEDAKALERAEHERSEELKGAKRMAVALA